MWCGVLQEKESELTSMVSHDLTRLSMDGEVGDDMGGVERQEKTHGRFQ